MSIVPSTHDEIASRKQMASWAQHFASYRKDVTINGAFASDFAKAMATMERAMKQ